MRKFQKQQLEEIIESMHLLHQEMKEQLEEREYPKVQTAFADCQEAAIQMGQAIEQMECEGTEAVACLEQYCEKVYHLSVQLETIQAQKLYKNLESNLIRAENAIAHIPVKKEIVFLPYKASMWDSLESVFLAAEEDENSDVYVIPIPYYDKNPDGSFREEHYEGADYPAYVPVTNYEDFDFAYHHPDMIFIHNPYDNQNFVTSVHPFFYSENIKKYTEKLVYIPYFILKEISPNDKNAIEKMKHFCTVPGVFHADRVVVQSEDMRKVYIDVLTEAVGNNSRKIWEDKIAGYGSPKYDKVLNAEKTELFIPEDWKNIMVRSDGSRKKVVFYNISVGTLLRHSDSILQKIEYVLGVFKQFQDDLVLLWRPHPLIKATVKSMRPQIWTEYEKITRRYKEEGWGIYDDTADLNRAISVSDAYYGDISSVVQLYESTGKPVMIQNMEITHEF